MIPEPDSIRFWRKVIVLGPDDCWEWIGPRHPSGYGAFQMKTANGWQPRPAHKTAFMLSGRSVSDERPLVLQTCSNRLCCNPRHLKAGNQREAQNRARIASTARSEERPSR